jgi:hypothetical protein
MKPSLPSISAFAFLVVFSACQNASGSGAQGQDRVGKSSDLFVDAPRATTIEFESLTFVGDLLWLTEIRPGGQVDEYLTAKANNGEGSTFHRLSGSFRLDGRGSVGATGLTVQFSYDPDTDPRQGVLMHDTFSRDPVTSDEVWTTRRDWTPVETNLLFSEAGSEVIGHVTMHPVDELVHGRDPSLERILNISGKIDRHGCTVIENAEVIGDVVRESIVGSTHSWCAQRYSTGP